MPELCLNALETSGQKNGMSTLKIQWEPVFFLSQLLLVGFN